MQKLSALEQAIDKKPLLYDKDRQMYYRVISTEESDMLKKEHEERISKNKNNSNKSQSK